MQARYRLQWLRAVAIAAGLREGHDLLTVIDAMLDDPDEGESLRGRLAAELRMVPREVRLHMGMMLHRGIDAG